VGPESAALEIKVRCPDPNQFRRKLAITHARLSDRIAQTDIYFKVPVGRLKLRTSRYLRSQTPDTMLSTLIGYIRPNDAGTRLSRFWYSAVDDPSQCEYALKATLGVLVEVHKRRDVWKVDNTVVHLDSVVGLGDFLELETHVRGAREVALREHSSLLDCLGITSADGIASSYAEMLLSRLGKSGENESID
jgi:adenylate cyclase, class 2